MFRHIPQLSSSSRNLGKSKNLDLSKPDIYVIQYKNNLQFINKNNSNNNNSNSNYKNKKKNKKNNKKREKYKKPNKNMKTMMRIIMKNEGEEN